MSGLSGAGSLAARGSARKGDDLRAQETREMAYVYIFRSGSENLFKIGRTDGDVEARIRQLATGKSLPVNEIRRHRHGARFAVRNVSSQDAAVKEILGQRSPRILCDRT